MLGYPEGETEPLVDLFMRTLGSRPVYDEVRLGLRILGCQVQVLPIKDRCVACKLRLETALMPEIMHPTKRKRKEKRDACKPGVC